MIKQLIKKIKNNSKAIIPWSLFAISIIVIIFLLIKLNNTNNNKNQDSENEIASIVNKVGKLIILPKDETPTIATITDLAALREAYKGEQFFTNAKEGYKLLIYAKSGTAILYDPIEDKIVEFGPVDSGLK